jgi:FMN hydrolase / 5-amino-6-(5-phospho-D-ribitylamino)uracil phosphatase
MNRIESIRAITLDLDDTLWPVGPTLVTAEQALADWLAANASRTAPRYTAGSRAEVRATLLAEYPERAHDMSFLRREGIRRALIDAGDDPALAEPAFDVFLAARQKVEFFADVRPVLARWSARYTLVAVTNGNADIQRVGLAPWISAAVSAHEIGCAKPDPRIYLEACRLAGVEPAEALHLGDDPHLDVLGARRAGLQAAWLRRPQFAHRHPAEGLADDAGPVFEDLHSVEAILSPTGR